jgi:hypothetical protein
MIAVEARDAVDVEKECRWGSGAAVSVGARITRVWPLNITIPGSLPNSNREFRIIMLPSFRWLLRGMVGDFYVISLDLLVIQCSLSLANP